MFAPILVVGADSSVKLESLRRAIRSVDPQIPVYNSFALDDLIRRATAARRLPLALVSAFGVLALLLAAVGLFGVVAESVVQRTAEFGVRRSVGASGRDIVRLVVTQGMGLALRGLVLGAAGALALARFAQSLLYGVAAHDPLALGLALAALALGALLACAVPAASAARVDPLVALRDE